MLTLYAKQAWNKVMLTCMYNTTHNLHAYFLLIRIIPRDMRCPIRVDDLSPLLLPPESAYTAIKGL
jgi:hypothetical protein